jgi:uncharacterized protein
MSALLCASVALAAAPRVDDHAGLFQVQTIDEANRIIEQIYTETKSPHREVLVETRATLPPGKTVQEVAEADFMARKANGLLILVVKRPGKLWVTVGEATRKGFGKADVEELVNRIMLPRLREKQPDRALLDGLRFIQQRFEVFRAAVPTPRATFLPSAATVPSAAEGIGHIGWFSILLLLLGGWLVIGLVRALFRPREPAMPGAAPGYGPSAGSSAGAGYPSGGGWGRAILGGLVGAMAGNWLYHNVFGGGSWGEGSAYAETGSDVSARPDALDEGRVADGAGGDWGDARSDADDRAGGGGDFESDLGDTRGGGGDFGDVDDNA